MHVNEHREARTTVILIACAALSMVLGLIIDRTVFFVYVDDVRQRLAAIVQVTTQCAIPLALFIVARAASRRAERCGKPDQSLVLRFETAFDNLVEFLVGACGLGSVNVAGAEDVVVGSGEVEGVRDGVEFAERKELCSVSFDGGRWGMASHRAWCRGISPGSRKAAPSCAPEQCAGLDMAYLHVCVCNAIMRIPRCVLSLVAAHKSRNRGACVGCIVLKCLVYSPPSEAVEPDAQCV